MPHILSSMAEYHRENARMSAKGRKTMAARRGSLRQPRGTAAMQCYYSPGRSTPPGSEIHRQDICQQTQSNSWPTSGETDDFHFAGAHRYPAELQDAVSGQSSPKTDTVRPTAGSQLAPAPASLPRPPSSWTAEDDDEVTVIYSDIPDKNVGSILSNQLKMLLKVQG